MRFAILLILFYKLTLVVGLALLLLLSLRGAPPDKRALLLRIGMSVVLFLPIAMMVIPGVDFATPAYFAPYIPLRRGVDLFEAIPRGAVAILAGIYVVGALLLLGRLAAGLWSLAKWTREGHPITCPQWRAVIAANAPRHIKVLMSDRIATPLSWGHVRPVILIDRRSAAQPDDAEAIVAHEAAHIRRRDWLALIVARMLVAFFWPHPLIWLLHRALVQHSEEAADAEAVAGIEPLRYAATLLECLKRFRAGTYPANGITTGGGLARRIQKIIEHVPGSPSRFSRVAPLVVVGYLLAATLIAVTAVCAQAGPPPAPNAATLAAIDATCHDYIDGQLEGNAARVARSLHPELVNRWVKTKSPHKPLELESESAATLLELTRKGVLKTPVEKWNRTCTILGVVGNAAAVRLDTPWWVAFFHMGNFDGKWLIVDGF